MSRNRVAIVLGFGWGKISNESYERLPEGYIAAIDEVTDHVGSSYEGKIFRGKKATDEALEWLRCVYDRGAIVFPSRGAQSVAQKALKQLMERRDNRRIRVIVLTGLLPDDEVVTLSKSWIPEIGWKNIIH